MKFKNSWQYTVGSMHIVTAMLLIFVSSCNNKPKTTETADTKVSGSQTYSDSSTSSVRVYDQDGRICIQQSSTYYDLIDFYKGAAKIPMLLKINKIDLCYADSVNKHKVYNVSAKSLLDNEDIHWEAQFTGTNLEVRENTLMITHEGVDTEEDYMQRFNLQTGKQVFACSYGDLRISIPNVREKRFLGYTSKNASGQPIQKMGEENLLGVVEYSRSSAGIDKVKLKLKRSGASGNIATYTPEMVLVPANTNSNAVEDGKSLILMKADEHYTAKDVTDFALQITFYIGDDNEASNILIPVVNDQLDIKQAKYDKDVFVLEQ